MASRRYRAKNSLNSNISQVNARISQISKRPSPRKIAEGTITSAQIREATITAANLDKGSVTNDKIAADAIRTGNIVDDAITTPKIVDKSITTIKLADGAIDLSNASVIISTLPVSKGGTGAVTFTAGFLKASGNSAFTTSSIQASDVPNLDAGKITSGTFSTSLIPNLDAGKITSGTFSTSLIPTLNALDKISSKTIGGSNPSYGGINHIIDNSIGQLNIGPDSVGNGELIDGAVTGAKIASNTITSGNIAAGAIGNSELADNSVTLSKIPGDTEYALVNNTLLTGSGIDKGARVGDNVTIFVSFGTTSNDVARGNHTHTVTVNGNAQTVTTSTPSTLKVKKDVQPYQPANIKNLLNLEPKTYKYKRSQRMAHQSLNKEVMHGYIVEELEALGFTEPIGYDENGSPDRLDYGLMSMLVLELVKAQQTEIDYLKEEINGLKDKK